MRFGEPLRDTRPKAMRAYYDRLRRLSPEQRIEIVRALNRAVRRMAESGLREQFPAAGDAEIRIRLAVRMYGRKVVARVAKLPDDAH